MAKVKKCSKCNKEKELTYFTKDKQKKDGLRSSCKECNNSYARKKRRVRDKSKLKDSSLRRNYGIDLETYNNILKSQNNKCFICKSEETIKDSRTGKAKPLCVDHCHKSDNIRGIICTNCNLILGKLKDDIELAEKVKNYLEKPPMVEKVKVFRESGRPVDLDKIEEFEEEWKKVFDKVMQDNKGNMPVIQKELDIEEKKLQDKYDVLVELNFPNNYKAMKKFIQKYGKIEMGIHPELDEIYIRIMDLGF